MKITPLEIRQKTFEKVFRGYDKDEVNAYLQSLSMEWERLMDENKELYQRIDNLEAESKKLRELESSLFKTLKTAEDTGATLIEQAKKETDLKLKESSIKAEELLTEARGKAKSLVENAESKRNQMLDEMINKIRLMENHFNQMMDLKEKVVGQIKNYSKDLMERIEKLEKKSEELNVKDIVATARQTYNSLIDGKGFDLDVEKEKKSDTEKLEKHKEKKVETTRDEKPLDAEGKKKETPAIDERKDINKSPFVKTNSMTDEGKGKTEMTDDRDKSSASSDEQQDNIKDDKKGQAEIGFQDTKKEKKSSSTSFFDEIE
jgi:cell division initiation protein